MKKTLLLFSIPLIIWACSSEIDTSNENKEPSHTETGLNKEEIKVLALRNTTKTSMTRSINEIQEEIQISINFLNNEDLTGGLKSTKNRKIKDIQILNSQSTINQLKSISDNKIINDTLAYIVNFDNNSGYTLIVADKRVDNIILAICPNGNLTSRTDNPGLSIFLECAENYIKESIIKYEQSKDSIYQSIISKRTAAITQEKLKYDIDDNYDFEGEVYFESKIISKDVISEQIRPLIPVEWSQGAPFNDKVRYLNCKEGISPAGCVPVAVAQLLAYWKYPNIINGKSYDWNNLTKYPNSLYMKDFAPAIIKDQVSTLMETIGLGLGMVTSLTNSYSCDGSGADSDNVPSLLKKYGYIVNGGLQDYNGDIVKNSIKNGQPVYICGYSHKKTFLGITTGYEGGHAWLIGGYLTTKTTWKYIATRVSRTDGAIIDRWEGYSYDYYNYWHNNWGWGSGGSNGYYSSFNANYNPVYKSGNGTTEKDYNYQYQLKIIPNIRK